MGDIEKRFKGEKASSLKHARELLKRRMKDKKKRYQHSLGVAQTAYDLAKIYDVDLYQAAAAGLVHDWDKVLDDHELMARAVMYGIEINGSPSHAAGLLHGPVAAVELPKLFPEFPQPVFQAVDRHTVGACDMSSLDMVVFIADCIEPNRHGDYAVALRELVGKVALEELFFQSFAQGLVYVIQTGRYMYPTAIDIYNHYAERR